MSWKKAQKKTITGKFKAAGRKTIIITLTPKGLERARKRKPSKAERERSLRYLRTGK